MRKGFRILITDQCNMACRTCFNRHLRTRNIMTFQDFSDLCNYLSGECGISRVKIMGGEPTTHPDFLRMVSYAQSKFKSVHIFTNAVNNVISSLHMRPQDTVIYNVACMPVNFSEKKLMPEQNFFRAFETRIDSNAQTNHIWSVLDCVHKVLQDKMVINLTLNCMENIFEHKDEIIENWNNTVDFIQSTLGLEYNIDHDIPYCFSYGTTMKIKKIKSVCNLRCAGLIAPDFSLRFCNQTQNSLLSIKRDGKFVPYKIIEQYLKMEHRKNEYDCLGKICKNCLLYGEDCSGGCFMFKQMITKESILQHSNLSFV